MPEDFETDRENERADLSKNKSEQPLDEQRPIDSGKKNMKIQKTNAFSSAAKESADLDNEPNLPAADSGRKMHRNMLPMIKKWGSSVAVVVLVAALFLWMLPLFRSPHIKNAAAPEGSQLDSLFETSFVTDLTEQTTAGEMTQDSVESITAAAKTAPGMQLESAATEMTESASSLLTTTSTTICTTCPTLWTFPLPQKLLDSNDPLDILRDSYNSHYEVPESKVLQIFDKINSLSDLIDIPGADLCYNVAGTGKKNLSYVGMIAADSNVPGKEFYMMLENYDTRTLELRRVHVWDYTQYKVLASKPLPSDCSYESTYEKWAPQFTPDYPPTLPFSISDGSGKFSWFNEK